MTGSSPTCRASTPSLIRAAGPVIALAEHGSGPEPHLCSKRLHSCFDVQRFHMASVATCLRCVGSRGCDVRAGVCAVGSRTRGRGLVTAGVLREGTLGLTGQRMCFRRDSDSSSAVVNLSGRQSSSDTQLDHQHRGDERRLAWQVVFMALTQHTDLVAETSLRGQPRPPLPRRPRVRRLFLARRAAQRRRQRQCYTDGLS
jgi:hypothetical protein